MLRKYTKSVLYIICMKNSSELRPCSNMPCWAQIQHKLETAFSLQIYG